MKQHKHAELIKAWADGVKIQERFNNGWHKVLTCAREVEV